MTQTIAKSTVYDFSADLLSGARVALRDYAGQVLLIVNTASACGFTPQYEGLEKLQRDLGPRGFNVLAFPCNQFGHQEPGTADEIATFCTSRYDVSFPVFAKIDVNGAKESPLFGYLKSQTSSWLGPGIKWNFTKFLVDRSGRVVSRFSPMTTPASIARHIEELL
jgi:glutathione peroxidase